MEKKIRAVLLTITSLLFSASLLSQTATPPTTSASPDSIASNFVKQLIAFPQEKIYAQIDKPYYIVGEDIWFRAHLIDALPQRPDTSSMYIYAELISPIDSVVSRVKVKAKDGAYFGQITLDEELAEGDYQLRFYTKYMESLGDDYFFKRTVSIGTPMSATYYTETTSEYADNGKKIKAEIRFFDAQTKEAIAPEKIEILDENRMMKIVDPDKDNVLRLSLKTPKEKKDNFLLVKYDYMSKFHKQYINIVPPSNDYDVTFFPEGGNLAANTYNRIGFKAINAKGLGENVKISIVNEKGDTLNTVESQHLGMGSFLFMTNATDKYFAVCKNEKGIEKRIELPAPTPNAISLQAKWQKNRLYIVINKPKDTPLPEPLYLIAQCRGAVLFSGAWDNTKEFITVEKEVMPTGIVQLIVADQNMNPISERLVFNINKHHEANVSFSTDKVEYKKRDLINAKIDLTDPENNPLIANLSMSITDDKDIQTDSCVNILSSMLLTSELKGYIEAPAYYFTNISPTTEKHLDDLLLTQGWSRYNVAKILKGEVDIPSSHVERGLEVSGTVKGGLLMTKPSANYPVSLFCTDNMLYGETKTNEKGRFHFSNFELPDSTNCVIQAKTKKGGSHVELILDPVVYPPIIQSLPTTLRPNRSLFENYIGKADQRYVLENGMRMIYLQDIVVTAKRTERKSKSAYSSMMNTVLTNKQIEDMHPRSIFDVLRRQGGVTVTGEKVSIRGGGEPLVVVDNIPTETDMLSMIPIEDVDEIEIGKDASSQVMFGSRAGNGVILITTKTGEVNIPTIPKFNIKRVRLLGYQAAKEFYSPKYETRQQKEDTTPDLRSTIYWNPAVKTDEGKAAVSFYSADTPSTYSVIIEGVTEDGRIVYAKKAIKTAE